MKFLDWLKLKEDGEGGGDCGGDFTPTVDSGTFTQISDIAPYIRPLFYNVSAYSTKKKKHKKRHKTLKEFIQAKNEYNVKNDIGNIINTILDEGKFVMYFVYEGDLFGVNDDQRTVYANILKPQDAMPPEDNFNAVNISAWIESNEGFTKIFYKKDIPKMHVMTKDQVKKTLHSITKAKENNND